MVPGLTVGRQEENIREGFLPDVPPETAQWEHGDRYLNWYQDSGVWAGNLSSGVWIEIPAEVMAQEIATLRETMDGYDATVKARTADHWAKRWMQYVDWFGERPLVARD